MQNLLQSGDVRRYHTTPRVRPQAVAQHAWGVAIIYTYLTGSRDVLSTLLHDCAEVFVGDIPAPIKAHAGIDATVRNLEEHYCREKLGLQIPQQTDMEFIADKLEAVYWTARDGSPDARKLNREMAAFVSRALPELALTPDVRAKAEELLKAWSL